MIKKLFNWRKEKKNRDKDMANVRRRQLLVEAELRRVESYIENRKQRGR